MTNATLEKPRGKSGRARVAGYGAEVSAWAKGDKTLPKPGPARPVRPVKERPTQQIGGGPVAGIPVDRGNTPRARVAPMTADANGPRHMQVPEPVIGVGERTGKPYFRVGEVPERMTVQRLDGTPMGDGPRFDADKAAGRAASRARVAGFAEEGIIDFYGRGVPGMGPITLHPRQPETYTNDGTPPANSGGGGGGGGSGSGGGGGAGGGTQVLGPSTQTGPYSAPAAPAPYSPAAMERPRTIIQPQTRPETSRIYREIMTPIWEAEAQRVQSELDAMNASAPNGVFFDWQDGEYLVGYMPRHPLGFAEEGVIDIRPTGNSSIYDSVMAQRRGATQEQQQTQLAGMNASASPGTFFDYQDGEYVVGYRPQSTTTAPRATVAPYSPPAAPPAPIQPRTSAAAPRATVAVDNTPTAAGRAALAALVAEQVASHPNANVGYGGVGMEGGNIVQAPYTNTNASANDAYNAYLQNMRDQGGSIDQAAAERLNALRNQLVIDSSRGRTASGTPVTSETATAVFNAIARQIAPPPPPPTKTSSVAAPDTRASVAPPAITAPAFAGAGGIDPSAAAIAEAGDAQGAARATLTDVPDFRNMTARDVVRWYNANENQTDPATLNQAILDLRQRGYSDAEIGQMMESGVDSLPMNNVAAESTYTIQPGDTLGAIAARYGTTVDALASANGIANPNLIIAGATLRIPGGGGTEPGNTPAPRASVAGYSADETRGSPPSSAAGAVTVPDYNHGGQRTLDADVVAAINANFPSQEHTFAYHVGASESGGNRNAVGDAGEVGIFQIHPVHFGTVVTLPDGSRVAINAQNLRDPMINAAAARHVWQQSQGWGRNGAPWTTAPAIYRALGI